jgi:hypothetical protein
MRKLRELWLRLRDLVSGQDSDQDITDELESVVQMHVDDNLRAGMTSDEARREALMRLSGMEQVRQAVRDRRGLPSLERFARDLKYAARAAPRGGDLSFVHRVSQPFYLLVARSAARRRELAIRTALGISRRSLRPWPLQLCCFPQLRHAYSLPRARHELIRCMRFGLRRAGVISFFDLYGSGCESRAQLSANAESCHKLIGEWSANEKQDGHSARRLYPETATLRRLYLLRRNLSDFKNRIEEDVENGMWRQQEYYE